MAALVSIDILFVRLMLRRVAHFFISEMKVELCTYSKMGGFLGLWTPIFWSVLPRLFLKTPVTEELYFPTTLECYNVRTVLLC